MISLIIAVLAIAMVGIFAFAEDEPVVEIRLNNLSYKFYLKEGGAKNGK